MVPSVLTPQLCQPPALTCVKAPAGGVARSKPLSPQQATLPSLLSTPQACESPALTWVKVFAGGVAWPPPVPLPPEPAIVPSVLSPHVGDPPALTWVKPPAGGVAWPQKL